ncbi:MAG: hypothetical protein WD176_09525 [Pirellulales bacterium]
MSSPDYKTRAAQCLVEHQIIQHVKEALRLTLAWEVDAVGAARKLSSIQFTMQSLFRHLDRLMKIEEEDGYLSAVAERKPNLAIQVGELAGDHGLFRAEMERIEPVAMNTPSDDLVAMNDVCAQLHDLLGRLDVHDQAESDLLQAAFADEEGGEG